MSDYNWCHGPSCHTNETQDRVRGSKGNKVLRTRKVAINHWNKDTMWRFFCSQGCYTEFFYKYWRQVIAIAPRLEALETPIDVVVETKFDWQDNPYKTKVIKEVVDNGESVG